MTRDEERSMDLYNDECHLEDFLSINKLKEKIINLGLCVDNEYLDKYCELIIKNKNTQYLKGKTHNHHIIPVFYFKINKLKIDNSPNNLVTLFRKEHALAHYYLFKSSKNNIISNYNYFALEYILPKNIKINKITDKDFLELIKDYNNYEIKLTAETKNKISLGCKGKNKGKKKPPISEETRKKLSIAHKGKSLTENHKEKLRKSNIGKHKNYHHSKEIKKIISIKTKEGLKKKKELQNERK